MYLPQGTELQNRYVIEGLLGHGGFGVTYLARDLTLNVQVAVKEYLPRQLATRSEGATQVSIYTGEAREHYAYGLKKFLDEARAVAQFADHPNIVSARDYFEAHGTAYMVMRYVQGVDFKAYLAQQGGKISFDLALKIMMPVMDALRKVHAAGLLHRDVSPDNIYLTHDGQVKLMDFGAARQQTGEHSKSLSVILKTGYAPAEQYRTKGKQGPWTDVYAAAATLYKAITGQTPPDALDRMAEETLIPPSQLGVVIPPAAEQALLKALAVNAGQRFQTMGEFQEALLGQQPVTGLMPPIPSEVMQPTPIVEEQAKKFAPRNMTNINLVIIIGGALLGVMLIGGLFWWNSVKQQTQSVTPSPVRPVEKETASNASNVKALLDQGRDFLKAKDYEKARVVLEKAVQLDPKKVEAYLELSRAFLWLKRHDEAIKASKEVLKLDAKNVWAYNVLGLACGAQGRHQEAIDYLKAALTYNPNFAPAQNNLGYAYARIGNMDKAREQYVELEKQDKEKAEKLLTYINKKAMENKAPPAGVGSIDFMQPLKARVKSIKLFETGKEAIPPKKRVYTNRFIKSATRFVACEISLIHPKPNRRIELSVKSVWRRSDGSLMREGSSQSWVESNWTNSWHVITLGNADYGAYWPPGDYRVDFYSGDKKIGSQAFQVVER